MHSALVFDWGKFAPNLHRSSQESPSQIDETCDALIATLKEGTQRCWGEMRATEQVLAEAAEGFDGEEPLLPVARSVLDAIREELSDLREQVKPHVGPFELPDPDEETLGRVRTLVQPEADR